MCSVGSMLLSTPRPWRPVYAYACCCLLPLSLPICPALRTATSLHGNNPAAPAGSSSSVFRSGGSRSFSGEGRNRAEWRGGHSDQLWDQGRKSGSNVVLAMRKSSDARKNSKNRQSRAGSGGKGNSGGGRKTAGTVTSAVAAKRGPEPKLDSLSDRAGFLSAFEYYRKANAPRKILQVFQTAKAKGVDGVPELAAAAVKAELKTDREDLAKKVIHDFGDDQWADWLARNPGEAQGVVKTACAANAPDFARELMRAAGLWVDDLLKRSADLTATGATAPAASTTEPAATGGLTEGALEVAAAVYPNLITAYARVDKRNETVRLLEVMAKAKLPVKVEASNHLLQVFHKRRDLEAVFKVLDAMATAEVDGDDRTYEYLANAAVTNVDFVTGAVSMSTLPKEPILPEAAFIGRSNVGKSSLINMVCNRKALAYTSKTPGKTQQFNYFVVNNNTENAFYLVDMPGLGYAKVPENQRVAWASFFKSYVMRRSSLRVLFHLIDGRHGPVGQDYEVMKLMRDMPDTARYVIVLTKADKSKNSVSKSVLESVVSALRDAGIARTPVVLTSATTRLGRDGMWRYLRLAALDKAMRDKREANLPNVDDVLDGPRTGVALGWRDMWQGDEGSLDIEDAVRT